jgi:hypothetical protein
MRATVDANAVRDRAPELEHWIDYGPARPCRGTDPPIGGCSRRHGEPEAAGGVGAGAIERSTTAGDTSGARDVDRDAGLTHRTGVRPAGVEDADDGETRRLTGTRCDRAAERDEYEYRQNRATKPHLSLEHRPANAQR